MDPRQALKKAAGPGPTQVGTDWYNTPSGVADSFRDQVGTPGDAALLTDREVKFLVDTMVDESKLLKDTRRVVMARPRMEIPRIFIDDADNGLQSAVSGGHPESTGAPDVRPSYNTITLTSSKLVLPWTITEEYFEDNPEGGSAEQTIARLMGIRAANDLERLAINGSEATGAGPLLHANDGYIQLINDQTPAGQILALGGANFTSDIFNDMLKALPTKYRSNPRNLRFYVSPNIWSDYVDVLAARIGDQGDRFLSEHSMDPSYKGVQVSMIPFMPETTGVANSTIILVDPKNFVWGVQRDMKLRKSNEGEAAIKLDERYYALHLRCDFQVQNPEAVVMATGVDERTP